jgi:hypothetical protein
MENTMNMKKVSRYTTAVSLVLALSTAYAAGDSSTSSSQPSEPLTGKQKATAIGARIDVSKNHRFGRS